MKKQITITYEWFLDGEIPANHKLQLEQHAEECIRHGHFESVTDGVLDHEIDGVVYEGSWWSDEGSVVYNNPNIKLYPEYSGHFVRFIGGTYAQLEQAIYELNNRDNANDEELQMVYQDIEALEGLEPIK